MGINCCDICRLGFDNCQDGDGNPKNLSSPLAAWSYDYDEYMEVLKKIDEAK